jgi:hypothetical protein
VANEGGWRKVIYFVFIKAAVVFFFCFMGMGALMVSLPVFWCGVGWFFGWGCFFAYVEICWLVWNQDGTNEDCCLFNGSLCFCFCFWGIICLAIYSICYGFFDVSRVLLTIKESGI